MAGAAGRMGRRIIALAADDATVRLVAALEGAGSPALGEDAGGLACGRSSGVPISQTLDASPADVLIEFTSPFGTLHWLDLCVARGMPIVIGTTGHSTDQLARIKQSASRIAIIKAANMSVGVNVLLRAVRMLSQTLDLSYDVEIVESHHRFKADAPSGTALALRDAVLDGRRDAGHEASPIVYGRHGHATERPAGEIGIHALRIGDTVGEHTVAFGNLGETITLSHSAHSRDTFAIGALRASKWIVGRPPGLYNMQDVLFGGEQ